MNVIKHPRCPYWNTPCHVLRCQLLWIFYGLKTIQNSHSDTHQLIYSEGKKRMKNTPSILALRPYERCCQCFFSQDQVSSPLQTDPGLLMACRTVSSVRVILSPFPPSSSVPLSCYWPLQEPCQKAVMSLHKGRLWKLHSGELNFKSSVNSPEEA